jgi:Methylmalonic aciduria and homocystinuria type D protein
MSPHSTLLPPLMASLAWTKEDPIECSVHTLPKPLMREFIHVFGEKYQDDDFIRDNTYTTTAADGGGGAGGDSGGMELLAIPTNQQARQDLVAVGEEIEFEKDRLLNVFLDFGKDLCEKLRAQGFWADYIDPCSGLPMMTKDCNKVYSEVDGMECLLNYRAYNAGFCKVLTHPRWGSAVYPATIFCYAPRDVVVRLVKEYQCTL